MLGKTTALAFALVFSSALTAHAAGIDIQQHAKGIWSIAGNGKEQRWVVIHNLAEARR